MSLAHDAQSLWFSPGKSGSAGERLRKTVIALTRARHRQLLLDHASGGLLAGLGAATLAVLACRLSVVSFPAWPLAAAVVLLALLIAVLAAWRRRPDALAVAIRADVALRLKQRLSTAWEYRCFCGAAELTDQLAAQAVNAGLPARAEWVFPLRLNRSARLVPLAAVALLLAGVADLQWLQVTPAREIDEQVVGEGRRLGAFARAMESRVQRDSLPRSDAQAAQLERLGARMESGALSRRQALDELRRMTASLETARKQAMADAPRAVAGGAGADQQADFPLGAAVDAAAMLDRMQRGALHDADLNALGRRLDDPAQTPGMTREAVQEAIKRHQAGDEKPLRQMLEKLADMARARQDEKALRDAQAQVHRTRQNLDKPDAAVGGGEMVSDSDDAEDGGREQQDADAAAGNGGDRRPQHAAAVDSTQAGSHAGNQPVGERRLSPPPTAAAQTQPLLQPQSHARQSEADAVSAQMSPRPNRAHAQSVEIDRAFAPQVEQVLAQDRYPAHYKDLVRRYFLNLSQGRVASQPTADKKGGP